jgi:hypothetical protein
VFAGLALPWLAAIARLHAEGHLLAPALARFKQ